jgi:hypothetical protein
VSSPTKSEAPAARYLIRVDEQQQAIDVLLHVRATDRDQCQVCLLIIIGWEISILKKKNNIFSLFSRES